MPKLFEEENEEDLELKTDTDYAKNYNNWRKKEELHKLQARYGDISASSDDSSSDDDEEPDANFDKDFFKTLSLLKTKDSRIYDKDFDLFDKTEDGEASKPNKKKKKEQPMYLKDYERKLMLEKGGRLSDDDDEQDEAVSKPFTYNDEQNELKQNLKAALNDIDEDDVDESKSENWGGLFKTREKTNQEKQKEDHDYIQWLAGQSENSTIDESAKNDLKPLKQFWSNPKLDEGEKFLRDYILKNKYLEGEDADYVPTYDEVIHDSDKDLSEDERAIDKQEEFEHKYNFRFEEPDQDFIKRYPRTMENSLRQKDDKRKVKRLERKERKVEEKKQKMEEIGKLKELKRLEIEEKIKKLKEITGNTDVAFDVKDFEDDFDPDEHDKRMQKLFNSEFYQGPEGEQKPEFPDLDEELELENWDRWHGDVDKNEDTIQEDNEYEPHCEDENFNMDCDYDPAATQQELINNSRRKKKRKRKSKFAQVLSEPKPVFDPNDRTYQEYLDEYYKLDCEDIIGDIPCRFKYRKVIPNDFGLSIEEILSAKDKELNRWCSLKKALQYRPEHVERYDVVAFSKKGQNIDLKKKYLPSLFEHENNDISATPSTSNNTDSVSQKQQKKKNKNANNNSDSGVASSEEQQEQIVSIEVDEKPLHKKKNKKSTEPVLRVTKDPNVTTTIATKGKKRKHSQTDVKPQNENNTESVSIKHKKQRKAQFDEVPKAITKQKKQKREKSSKKRQKVKKSEQDVGMSDARLAAYGFKPKKFKNKLKYGNAK